MDSITKIRNTLNRAFPYIGLLLLVAAAMIFGGEKFISVRNLRNIMIQASMLMVLAIGSTFVMAHGDMDFANGGTMGLTMVVVLALLKGIPAWLVLPVCILVGALIGLCVGVLTTKLRVAAFIVGMCIMRLSSAILYSITLKTSWMAPMALFSLNKPWFYITSCLIMLALGIVVFEFTKVGQFNKLIGVNREAAKLTGINVDKYLIMAFMASGLCAGAAAFMTTVRIGGLSNSTGNYEVDVLIALTIGGMPLTGGSKASMSAPLIGALSLTILNNILVLQGVNADFVNVVKGLVFLTLVLISSRQKSGTINI